MNLLIFKILLSVKSVLLLSYFILVPICNAAHLTWSPNTEEDLAGYKVYYGTSSEHYEKIIDIGKVTQYELSNLYLYEDESYYISITAYDDAGNESGFSNVAYFTSDEEISDFEDNCPTIYNPNQEDTSPPTSNGIGDACDCEGDFDCDGDVDGLDNLLFQGDFGRDLNTNHPCTDFDPCNGDFDCDGDVDGVDMFLFRADSGRNAYSNPCPDCVEGDWCTYP